MASGAARGRSGQLVQACPRESSVPTSSVRTVAQQQGATALVEAPSGAGTSARADGEVRRCGWCRRVLSQQGSVGRPRLYCTQACRQRAYEQRAASSKAGLPEDVVIVSRAELDGLQDRLYQLRCALEDVQTTLDDRPTKAELERSLTDLVRSTGRLDRLWVTERR